MNLIVEFIMATYRKNPSDNDQHWLESAANDSAIRWHGFDHLNQGEDKFFPANGLPNNPDALIAAGVSNGPERLRAGVSSEWQNGVERFNEGLIGKA